MYTSTLYIYIYIFIYICVCVYIYICMYVYITNGVLDVTVNVQEMYIPFFHFFICISANGVINIPHQKVLA